MFPSVLFAIVLVKAVGMDDSAKSKITLINLIFFLIWIEGGDKLMSVKVISNSELTLTGLTGLFRVEAQSRNTNSTQISSPSLFTWMILHGVVCCNWHILILIVLNKKLWTFHFDPIIMSTVSQHMTHMNIFKWRNLKKNQNIYQNKAFLLIHFYRLALVRMFRNII